MSQVHDSNPLENILPHLEGFLLRSPSPEILAGARERFAHITEALANSTAAFVEMHNSKTEAEIKLSHIAAKRDVILAKDIELSPDASKVHDQNTAKNIADSNVVPINKYHPPIAQTALNEFTKIDEPEHVKEARRLYEEALGRQRTENNVVELFRNRSTNDEQLPLAG